MDEAKIRLSPNEMALITDAGWILTKNDILKKTEQLLGELQLRYQDVLHSYPALPAVILDSSPKISKGENYKGLPYRVLDYPRQFDQQDVFAIRTLFWWGNFFSITLHLSGRYKKQYEKKLITALPLLHEKGFYYCINEDPWQHHFEKDNYLPLTVHDEAVKWLGDRSFLKLAKRVDLREWDKSLFILQKDFQTLIEMLH